MAAIPWQRGLKAERQRKRQAGAGLAPARAAPAPLFPCLTPAPPTLATLAAVDVGLVPWPVVTGSVA